MKNLSLVIFIFASLLSNVFATESIEGSVLLLGKEESVIVETDIQTAKYVYKDKVKFQILAVNDREIFATNSDAGEVSIYLGSILQKILSLSRDDLQRALGFSNIEELNCHDNSKGFLLYTFNNKILANCIN